MILFPMALSDVIAKAAPGGTNAKCWRAFFGLLRQVPAGDICLKTIRLIRPVIAGFSRWVEESVFDRIIEAQARDLQERGGIDMSECFIDGTFSLAKKGAFCGKD
jgi:hypothetical protein